MGETTDNGNPLSLDEVQALPDNHRSDYLAMRRMFEGSGWKMFMDWLSQQARELQNRQLTAKTWEDVLQARGGVSMAAVVASIEQITDITYRGVVESLSVESQEGE